VLIATVACDREPRLCDQFPDFLTPTIWWVSTVPGDAERYIGAETFSELASYVENRISRGVIVIENGRELEEQFSRHRNSSIFVVQNVGPSEVERIRVISVDFENFPCHFFCIGFRHFESDGPFFGNFFVPTGRLTVLKNEWTDRNLRTFVEQFAFPPISAISQNFFTHARTIGTTVLLLSDEPPGFERELLELTPRLPEDLRCGILYCQESPRACLKLMIPKGRGPSLLLHNPSKRLNWYYRGPLTSDAIVEWVGTVLAGGVRPAGPGAGFFGFLGNLFDSVSERGVIGIGLFAALVFVFVMIFVIGVAQTIRNRDRAAYQKLD
jgi:hypothetical protein